MTDLGCRVGRRADALRKQAGLTKAALADRAEMDPSTLSVLLNGGRPEFSIQTLIRLRNGLRVGLDELLEDVPASDAEVRANTVLERAAANTFNEGLPDRLQRIEDRSEQQRKALGRLTTEVRALNRRLTQFLSEGEREPDQLQGTQE